MLEDYNNLNYTHTQPMVIKCDCDINSITAPDSESFSYEIGTAPIQASLETFPSTILKCQD